MSMPNEPKVTVYEYGESAFKKKSKAKKSSGRAKGWAVAVSAKNQSTPFAYGK